MATPRITLDDVMKGFRVGWIHNVNHFNLATLQIEETPEGSYLIAKSRRKPQRFRKIGKLKPIR